MANLYQNSNGSYYTKTKNLSGQIVTLQIREQGAKWLIDSSFDVGDTLGAAFWELKKSGWLHTLGETTGGGEPGYSTNWIQHDAFAINPVDIEPNTDEPLTVPTGSEFASAPRFLFAPSKSIYYTILNIENSSDYWLEVPLLIKQDGAMELLRLGAGVGEEFTEEGLRLLFVRRWCYFDEDRYSG
ncbi:MAG: hypothetical protein AVDCRST_MAG93-3662 [uncultured Chloroflexia bacterium]|uniref:Uncharacterized protein n=1 Tax=uncultured Chloroflexia bacterium TaxID=1672391 RepID=A0A6J4JU48_9CHLR|nr:MAG: hypothetical protein AVDCRST_MAG93-3662 [uncultured Chloroflexia bacterium]